MSIITFSTNTVQSDPQSEYMVEESDIEQGYAFNPDDEVTLDLSTAFKPLDLSAAQAFITALTGSPDTRMNFRTFAETEAAKAKEIRPKTPKGSVAALQTELQRLNNEGSGVFFTVQKATGDKAEDVTAIRALFVDFDGHLPTGSEWHLQPSIIVRNADNKGHAYWVLSELQAMSGKELTQYQDRLVTHYFGFGADFAATDIARVLRLPGSWHVKGIPTQVTNDRLGSERYSVDAVMAGISSDMGAVEAMKAKYSLARKAKGTNIREPKQSNTLSLPSKKDNGDFERIFTSEVYKVAHCLEGGRNKTLFDAANTLAGLDAKYFGGAKEGIIRADLTQAAMVCGLGLTEIETTLNSGIKKGHDKPIEFCGSAALVKLTLIEVAHLLKDEVLTDIQFDTEADQWYQYDGKGKWKLIKYGTVFKLCHLYVEDKVLLPTTRYLHDCIQFAQSHVQVDGWKEVSSLLYLPFTNGVLDIKANTFLPHSPDYGFTWQLPREYSPLATDWTRIDRFLDTLANGDQGLKLLAIAFCNAVLKGRSDLGKCLYLFGSGANGKGVYISLLQMLVGLENIHSTNMTELNTNTFEPANLKNKRLAVLPDEDKYSGKTHVFKSATSGNAHEYLRYERKGKDASLFLFQGMMVIAANKPTFLGNQDGGIQRRVVSFPCNYVVPAMERRDLTPMFETELPAFTTYLLSLDDAWVTKTIHSADTIEAVKALGEELAIRGNSVAAFYHEKLEPNPDKRVVCSGLYKSYQEYCLESGVAAKSLNNFTPDLIEYCKTSQGLAVVKGRSKEGNYLKGIQTRG
jgi:P4 family phage/plasmid primase-like protien